MKKTLTIVSLLTAALLLADGSTVQEKLSSKLVNTKIDKVVPSTDMEGLYEVYAGQNIMYANDKAEVVMLGHIFDLNGVDLTQQKLDVMAQESLKKNVDLTKALKIGNGKHEVIVFTDTECPYCRKAEDMIKDGNMTQYVFFTPLPFHQKAKPQSIHILCSKDQAKEYARAMKGELDNDKNLKSCKAGEEQLAAMMEVGVKNGVQGTPMFYIDGKKISGANPAIVGMVK
ncbi:MAG: DsbC family protein [Sulfurimonas sp.]|jgi:thiol:disulfide interchange protein DsbC